MLDTKLKKSHKKKNLIIALIVLIPALLLVCLYPQMEKAMIERRTQWQQEWEKVKEEKEAEETTVAEETEAQLGYGETEYYLEDNFVNYAVETSYYQYAKLLQEAENKEVYTDVLEWYGWINDYYELTGSTPYYAEYHYVPEIVQETTEEVPDEETTGTVRTENITAETEETAVSEETIDKDPAILWTGALDEIKIDEAQKFLSGEELDSDRMEELRDQGFLGYLILEYDSYGKLSDTNLKLDDGVHYAAKIYQQAKNSIQQYQTNVQYYKYEIEDSETADQIAEKSGDFMQTCPKNFKAIYFIFEENSRFLYSASDYESYDIYDSYEPYYSETELYFTIGAYWIVLALAVLVAMAALILPFFKKLETGWEKLFSLPAEVIAVIGCLGISLTMGMGLFMSVTTMEEMNNMIVVQGTVIELLGYEFSAAQCYYMLLFVNFLGWALTFFMEYICVAHIRQFFCSPKYYVKHRLLGIVFLRWLWKQCKRLYHYIIDIDIQENLQKSILKIVLANAVIVTLLCCMWFVGIAGIIIYSVLLYILMKKYGSTLQKQYQSILNATGQMAEGDLFITLEEDLGIFEPLGKELEGVKEGFSKAVAEEAKSQNMKSELITNVSHDLKTPLTAIITYVDLLKKPDITEEERNSYIETLDIKSQRLKVLIEDLFEVSKANSGNVTMNYMDVDIVKLMKEVRVEMSDRLEESTLDFRWNLPEEKVILSLDGQRTYRIFENLLNNAVKYAMPYTRVYVDIANEESEVTVTFRNISSQELKMDADYLTERFVRGDSARKSEGSGLGLAIAKSFTELQNGDFQIHIDGDLFKVSIRFLKEHEKKTE